MSKPTRADTDVSSSASAGIGQKHIRTFRWEDAAEVDGEIMAMEGVDDAVQAGFRQLAGNGLEEAQKIRCLFRDSGDPGSSLVHIWYKSGFVLPRHRHDADCVYYIIAGEIQMGNVVLRQGDGMFIPKNRDYMYSVGPDGVELLEYRNASRFNIVFDGRDSAQWTRMVQAAKDNADAWKQQNEPPARRK
jgi:mannose-6-phosphate isomerase-like protein (cupin superfamily)